MDSLKRITPTPIPSPTPTQHLVHQHINILPKTSTHTCPRSDHPEGTYQIEGVTGQTEYYCANHYLKLMDMFNGLFN